MELDLSRSLIMFNSTEVPFVLDSRGEPWFYGNKLAGALGFADPSRTVKKCVDVRDRKPLSDLLAERGGEAQ